MLFVLEIGHGFARLEPQSAAHINIFDIYCDRSQLTMEDLQGQQFVQTRG